MPSHFVGHPNTPSPTERKWRNQIHGVAPDPAARHCRRGRAIVVWGSQCASHARRPERGRDVFDI